MTFRRVSAEQRAGDVVNYDTVTLIPPSLLIQDHARWEERMSAGEVATDAEESVASYMHDLSVENMQSCAALMRLLRSGIPPELVQGDVFALSAQYAFARMIDALTPEGGTYSDGDKEYAAPSEQKFLIDMDPSNLACGGLVAVVARRALAADAFEGEQPADGEEAWYLGDNGLYIAARNPALHSESLVENLSIATGGREQALAVIDAPNSVSLTPHMSLRYLKASTQAS